MVKVSLFSATMRALMFDLRKMRARFQTRRMHQRSKSLSQFKTLQLGSGSRYVQGWLNLDLEKADINIDFSQGKLPFKDCQFDSIVSQHLIEHLDLEREVMPLMKEVHRVLATKGEFWVSCPDIEKICKSYMDNKCEKLIEGRKKRDKDFSLEQFPSSMFINTIFYQNGEHKNLFDFELLEFVLKHSGFHSIEKVSEYQMLDRFKELPPRHDDEQALYVKAVKTS